MKKAFIIFILTFVFAPIFSQSYTFINGAWGYENCQSEICGNTETPSELYWADNELSVCIVQDNGEHISKSFTINETSNNSLFDTADYLLQTNDGYIVHLSGYFQSNKIIILSAQIYFDGFVIGVLSYPIVY